jgi:hypothetical protein
MDTQGGQGEGLTTYTLEKAERLALIRFCLSVGTRLKCSTRQLLRPFDMKLLEAAFAEQESKTALRVAGYRRQLDDYKSKGILDKRLQAEFETAPSEAVKAYFAAVIKQTEGINFRKSFQLAVDYAFLTPAQLAFHASLNPRVTFGYSNVLHEECDCAVTQALRERLMPSFINAPDQDDFYSCGGFIVEEMLFYDDLAIWREGRPILETISHETMFALRLTEDELLAFIPYESKPARNRKIVRKLKGR